MEVGPDGRLVDLGDALADVVLYYRCLADCAISEDNDLEDVVLL